jgi:predicted acetyltransferase
MSSAGIDIRVITEDELGAWARAGAGGFLRPPQEGELDFRREFFVPGRSLGAFDGERCVGTFRSFDLEMTVPGGDAVVTDAVTSVTVTSTHRRRGILSRMMAQDLAAAVAERGQSLAILDAAEYRIYGRFGFGPAAGIAGWEIDVRRAGGVRVPPEAEGGTIELLTMEQVREYGPELYDRFRRTRPGVIRRLPQRWRIGTGELRVPGMEWQEPFVALYRDPDGTPAGMLAYTVDDVWRHQVPHDTLTVRDHLAVHPAAAAALWRYALSVDWVARVVVENTAPDDPLPLLLDDPRACVPWESTCGDWLWVRVLDAPAAFAARRYDAPGRVVFQVTDCLGYVDGRYAVEAGEDGKGGCAPTGDTPELALDVSALGSLYLGGESVHRLVAAGLVRELVPGAVARADRLLRSPVKPWNPDTF